MREEPTSREGREPARLGPRAAEVQRVRRLARRRDERAREASFVIEGLGVLTEALRAGASLDAILAAPDAPLDVIRTARSAGVRVVDVTTDAIERASSTDSPQALIAVARTVDVELETVRDASLALVCVAMSDPGNAGTVLRSAEASGVGAVVFCDGSVDVYNPKAVRASAGSLFHVRVVTGGDPVSVLERMGSWGLRRLGAVATRGDAHTEVDLRVATAIVLGNEARGLPESLEPVLDGYVHVPMAGRGTSLNVAAAATIICFEAARQRSDERLRGEPTSSDERLREEPTSSDERPREEPTSRGTTS